METVISTPSRTAASTARGRRDETDAARGGAAFAALVSAMQAAYGAEVAGARAGASAGSVFSPAMTGDARQQRIDRMTAEARDAARTSAARGAGLSDAPETKQLGGRAQRLWAQKETAADPQARLTRKSLPVQPRADGPVPSEAPRSDAEGLRPRNEPAGGALVGRHDRQPVYLDRTNHHGGHAPASPAAMPAGSGPRPTSGATRAETGGAASRSSAAVAGVQRNIGATQSAPTVARQIAQVLGDRLHGAQLARVADGAGMARSDSHAARSSRLNVRGEKADAPVPSRGPSEVARANFERLVRSIRMNIGTHQSTAKLRLHPPELGQVRVDVKMVGSRLELRIEVEKPIARELIGDRLELLRSVLQEHGVITERLELVEERPDPRTFAAGDDGRSRGDPDGAPASDGRTDGRGQSAGPEEQTGTTTRAEESEQNDDTLVTALDARLDIHI